MSIKKITLLLSLSLLVFSQSAWAQCGWSEVSIGGYHTLGIKPDGTLWAWGRNDLGQLGLGSLDLSNKNYPVQVGTDNNWAKIAAGGVHSLAIKTDGTLWAWGHNGNRELGDNTRGSRFKPVQIGTATDWVSIGAGYGTSFGERLSPAFFGTIYSWGELTFQGNWVVVQIWLLLPQP